MEKVLVTAGTKIRLSDIFTDIQSYAKTNLDRLTNLLFESFGINTETNASGIATGLDFYPTVNTRFNVAHIAAGDGLTAALNYINMPTPLNIPYDPSLSGIHTLYLKYQAVQDTFVDVIDGSSFPPGTTRVPSREHASMVPVWDVNPGISGIVIANYLADNSGFLDNGVVDRRSENILRLSSKILPRTVVRRDQPEAQSLTGPLFSPMVVVQDGIGNELVITPGSSGVQSLSGSDVASIKRNLHVQNTDTGTTSTTFRIGVGTLGNSGTGLLAETLPDAPPAPGNIRLTDIYPMRNSWYLQNAIGQIGLLSTSIPIWPVVGATIRWNWDDIQGTGGNGIFTITTSVSSWTLNQLIGYYLYLPPYDLDVVIIGNTATSGGSTTLTVKNTDYTSVDLTGKSLTGGSPGMIYPNCDRYELVAVPVDGSSNEIPTSRVEQTISYKPARVINSAVLELLSMRRYNIYVRAVLREQQSPYTKMSSGTYSKDPSTYSSSTFAYSSPLVAQLPSLKSTGVTLVATPKPFGFMVTINDSNLWSLADNYEYVWTWANQGANFQDYRMERSIQREKTLRVTTTEARTFNIKARPLMAGQSVIDTSVIASGISTDVLSGGGGQAEGDFVIFQEYVRHRTYRATVSGLDGNNHVVLTNVTSPFNGGSTVVIGSEIEGEIFFDTSGNTFILTSYIGTAGPGYVYAWAPTGNPNNVPEFDIIALGTSEYARRVRTIALDSNIQLTRAFIDCDVMTGTQVRVRWYQDTAAGKAMADSVLVTASDTGYAQSSDIIIHTDYGARNLAIDFYDDGTSPDNNSGFSGAITLYGQYYTLASPINTTMPINVPIESDTGN